MSVEITFHPADLKGLVAEGTHLIDAAKRMGIRLPVDCQGHAACSTCVVLIVAGQPLLSRPTLHEREILGAEGLGRDRRLACHAIIEKSGELVVEIMTLENPSNDKPDQDVRKTFASLPLNEKLTTLVQLEVVTVSAAIDSILERSISVGEKLMDVVARRGRRLRDQASAAKRPPQKRQ